MAMLWNGTTLTPARRDRCSPPIAPDGLSATAITHDQINLTWNDNSADETGFKVERSPDDATWAQIGTTIAGDNHYWDTSLDENTQYYYRVRAYNACGNSAYTASANDTTLTYELEDQFTTNEAAPIASPRTCEPGPGELVRVDSGNRMSISSQTLTAANGSATWGDPGYYGRNDDDSAFARGRYFEFELEVDSAGFITGCWTNSTTTSNAANHKHLFWIGSSNQISCYDVGNDASQNKYEYTGLLTIDTTYTVRIYALAAGGALWMVKGGYFGTQFRPLAYSLNESDASIYPAILNQTAGFTHDDARVVQASPPTLYVAYYNGKQGAGASRIGRAVSDDLYLGPQVENYVLDLGGGGAWDDAYLAWPYVLKDGATWKMWYAGNDGSTWQIGYATSADGITWAKDVGNPCLTVGAGGAWDDAGVLFPVVYKDGAADPAKRWKMLYTGYDGSVYQIGYAYSADGITWNKGGANPVVANGGAGAFDQSAALSGALVKLDGTYYLFYEGNENFVYPTPSKMGLATFADFEGAYTKSAGNPILSRRTGNQALTANCLTGATSCTVADSSGFVVNEVAMLVNDVNTGQQVKVTGIPDGTTINFTPAARADFTTAANSRIQSTVRSFMARSVVHEYGLWRAWTSAYGIGQAAAYFESTYYATSTSPSSGWAFDHAHSPPLWLPTLGKDDLGALNWAGQSAENPMFALDADTMLRVTE